MGAANGEKAPPSKTEDGAPKFFLGFVVRATRPSRDDLMHIIRRCLRVNYSPHAKGIVRVISPTTRDPSIRRALSSNGSHPVP